MSELDQTIEELEAEVLAELEEASEKPLGKAKDLGLGSSNAGDSVKKSKDPAPEVAGADKKEEVPGERKDVGGQKHDAAKGDAASGEVTKGGPMKPNPSSGKGDKVKLSQAADGSGKEASASNNLDDQEIGKAASSQAKPANDKDTERQEKEEPKVKQGSSGEATPGEKKKLAAGDDLDLLDGDELAEDKRLTKAQHLENIARMKKSDIEEMIAAHASKIEEAESAETEEALKELEDAKADIEEKIKNISVKEDVRALVEGEELSEEFKEKAAHIFEAAVKSKIRSEVGRIVDETQSEKNQEIEAFVEEMTEKVDNYLNYVVDEWTKENELAIERGLKGEIAEDFISGLKQLFEDHYIDVPDEKYDVLEAQSEKISELEGRLNEAIQKNVEFKHSNSELVREQVILEVAEDLVDTEAEKFKSLTQDIEFVDENSFREKLDTLKENYFPRVNKSSNVSIDYEEDGGTAQDIDTTDAMKSYMSAISRNKARAE
jgi:hypothetical protein